MSNYRAIYLGNDKWAVRRFSDGVCDEAEILLHVDDPELRESDKQAVASAIAKNEWKRV